MCPWFTTQPFFQQIHCAPYEGYHAVRFEKESQYYVIRLSKDLLGDWVITSINGRIKSKIGQSRTAAFTHFSEAFDQFCDLAKIRQQRGYELKTLACDNPLMMHLLPFMPLIEEKKEPASVKIIKSTNPRKNKIIKSDSPLTHIESPAPSQQLGFGF